MLLRPKIFWMKSLNLSLIDWWTTPSRPCTTCNEYGVVIINDRGEQTEVDCHCYLRLRDQIAIRDTISLDEFPEERYGEVSFDSTIEPTVVTSAEPKKALALWKEALQGTSDFIANPEGFISYVGMVGCGKTHCAALIYNYTYLPKVWLNVPRFTSTMAGLFSERNGKLTKIMDGLSTIPLLVFDEIGKGGLEFSAGVSANLYTIINNRYDSKLPTVFTSNINFETMAKSTPAIASRVFEQSPEGRPNIFYFLVDDYRRRTKRGAIHANPQ